MSEHSPTPWKCDTERSPDGTYHIFAAVTCNDGYVMWPCIAMVGGGCGPVKADDPDGDFHLRELPNTKHIVKCVNLHDELVAALGSLVGECESYDEWDRSATKDDLRRVYGSYRALLAKAKGEV